MKVFLSWAGPESKHIAQTLLTWLPQVIQTLEPWMSTRIDKGDAWDGAIADALYDTPIGILCLTQDSLDSKYLHYEAGAIANIKGSKVCTFLFGIKNTDVTQPLGRFQHTQFTKDDIFILLQTINNKIEERGGKKLTDTQLAKSLDLNWAELETKITQLPKSGNIILNRSERDILEEILEIVRSNKNNSKIIKSSQIPLFDTRSGLENLSEDSANRVINAIHEFKRIRDLSWSDFKQVDTQLQLIGFVRVNVDFNIQGEIVKTLLAQITEFL